MGQNDDPIKCKKAASLCGNSTTSANSGPINLLTSVLLCLTGVPRVPRLAEMGASGDKTEMGCHDLGQWHSDVEAEKKNKGRQPHEPPALAYRTDNARYGFTARL